MKFLSLCVVACSVGSLYGIDWGRSGLVYSVECKYQSNMPLVYEVKSEKGHGPLTLFSGSKKDISEWQAPLKHGAGYPSTGTIFITPQAGSEEFAYAIEIFMMSNDAVKCTTKNVAYTSSTGEKQTKDVYHWIDLSRYMKNRPAGSVWDIEVTIAQENCVGYISKLCLHPVGKYAKEEYNFGLPQYLGGTGETPQVATSARRDVAVGSVQVNQIASPSGVLEQK